MSIKKAKEIYIEHFYELFKAQGTAGCSSISSLQKMSELKDIPKGDLTVAFDELKDGSIETVRNERGVVQGYRMSTNFYAKKRKAEEEEE